MNFPTNLAAIEKRLKNIDITNYSRTRNFKDGAVTGLSPYISRGVISTKQIYKLVKNMDLPWHESEKFVMELAWRDYFQQVWIEKKQEIFRDLKNQQTPINNYEIPKAIINATTGINAVDDSIKQLYDVGYMHNHMRMYVAAICCNNANSYWLNPAKWLFANLLDGDLASNHLSWQWVAGTFSKKKYYVNQENINRYFNTNQKDTFLSVEYEELENLPIPEQLQDTFPFYIITKLPKFERPNFDTYKKTLIYNYYNIDPYWHKDEDVQRVFLLEPSLFRNYPVADHCIKFVLALCKNINGIKIFVSEFSELKKTAKWRINL